MSSIQQAISSIIHQEFDTDVLIIGGRMAGCKVATAAASADPVTPGKTGVEEKPGFRVKLRITEFISLMPSCMKHPLRSNTDRENRSVLAKNTVCMNKYEVNIFGGLEWK